MMSTTPVRILAGAVLLNLMTGSLYAWSLFIAPAQEALDVGRAAVSSIFAVATVAPSLPPCSSRRYWCGRARR